MPVLPVVDSPSQSVAFGQYGMNGAYTQADPILGVNGDPWIQHGTSVRSPPGFRHAEHHDIGIGSVSDLEAQSQLPAASRGAAPSQLQSPARDGDITAKIATMMAAMEAMQVQL